MRSIIVMLHSGHPNDATSAEISRRSFAELGYALVGVNLDDASSRQQLLDEFLGNRRNDVFFFLSANYYGTRVRTADGHLIHRASGIPLVIQQHDHPLVFLADQSPALAGTYTFAADEPSARFVERRFSYPSVAVANLGSTPHFDLGRPTYDDFMARENAILAPLNFTVLGYDVNGIFRPLDVDAVWARIRSLPAERRRRCTDLAEAAADETLEPITDLDERLHGVPEEPIRADRYADLLLVINFLKLYRRVRLVRELLDLPALFATESVPAEFEFRHRRRFVRLSMAETLPLYQRYRFTLNANPMLHALHDRVTNALFANAVAITDRNQAMESLFVGDRDLIYYEHDHRDTARHIAAYIDDPEAAFALTQSAYERRIASRFRISAYAELVATIGEYWERGANDGMALVAARN